MDESTQGQAVPPGGREVGDIHPPVSLGLPLTPGQQAAGSDLGLCVRVAACQSVLPFKEYHTASKERAFSCQKRYILPLWDLFLSALESF